MSRFENLPEVKPEVELTLEGKVKLVEPKGFKLRADARCEERKKQKEAKEKTRLERERVEK